MLPVFGVRVSVTFHLKCVHITFSSLSPMLHAMFQDNGTSGSGEDFYTFLPYMGILVILIM